MIHDVIRPYVEAGLVSARHHDGLVIYNYTDRCTYSRAWDTTTRACRGLIVREDSDVVVARPFEKFFNLGEPDAVIPPGPPSLVSDKRDGSLGISYVWRGRVRWSTRGSMTSPQAAIAQRIWDSQYAAAMPPEGYTILVEIESPEIESIVRSPVDRLVFLGMRRISDGYEPRWAESVKWAHGIGMPVAEAYEMTPDECLRAAETLPPDREGWVLRWDHARVYRLKVKGREYLNVARMMQALNGRGVCDAWYYGRTDLMERIPEEFRGEIEAAWHELDTEVAALEAQVAGLHASVRDMPRKEAVAHVGVQHPAFALVMQALDGKGSDFKCAVYRARTGHRYPRPNFETVEGEG